MIMGAATALSVPNTDTNPEDNSVQTSQDTLNNVISSSPSYILNNYRKPQQYIREGKKIHRNDPCPCGATDENGKPLKYKKCCGKIINNE